MSRILVIGVADPVLSTRQRSLLSDCLVIVGARRLREMAAGFAARYEAITPLAEAMAALRCALPHGNVAVLASGDPLFYGIGRRLLAEFPEASIDFFPALSSIQRGCALFRIPWDDATITSLHGRSEAHLPGLLLRPGKHLVLTDGTNSPGRIAAGLLDYLAAIGEDDLPAAIRMLVAEDLGMATERVFRGTLAEGLRQKFSALNLLCLVIPNLPEDPGYSFGLSEEQLHHSRGLITKNEVRAATLHQLRLPASGVLWDIGAGSGSLSIEAARANPGLTVYAVEQKNEELANIKKNIVKFRCFNIVPVAGSAPSALAGLPLPQRVFIGGSGGALPEIVPAVAARLVAGGVLVINGVARKTVETAPGLMRAQGFSVQTSVVQVSRTDPEQHTVNFNPITIMTGNR